MNALERKYHSLLQRTLALQLSHTPDKPTRNRKPLEDLPGPAGSTWELRCGPKDRFRVFYEVRFEDREVWILVIAVKDRDHLFIGGKEFEL